MGLIKRQQTASPTWQAYTNMAKWQMPSIEWNLFVECHSATRKFTVTILCTRGRLRLCNALSSEIRIKKWKHNAQIFEEFHSEVVRVKGLTFYLPRLLHRSKYILFHSHSCMSWAGFTEFWFESANKLILWVFFNEIRYNLRSNRHVLNANRKCVRWKPFTQISLSLFASCNSSQVATLFGVLNLERVCTFISVAVWNVIFLFNFAHFDQSTSQNERKWY